MERHRPRRRAPGRPGTFDDIETFLVDFGSVQLSLTVEDAGWFVAARHGGDLYYTVHETRTETAVNTANGKTMVVVIKGLFFQRPPDLARPL